MILIEFWKHHKMFIIAFSKLKITKNMPIQGYIMFIKEISRLILISVLYK
jgi:hypothetical protein